MINLFPEKIRQQLSNKDGRVIAANFFSLGIIQGTNFILPLIVLPYLIHVIGLEKFGLVAFAQAFMSYFIIFTDYGFNLTSTRLIAIHKQDRGLLQEITINTLLTKLLLCLIGFVVAGGIIVLSPYFQAHAALFFISFLLVVAQVMIPTWFFQGVQEMKFITYINLVAKMIFTCLIFLLIKKPADYIYVTLFYSLGNIVSGIISLIIVRRRFGIRFRLPASYHFAEQLKSGWYVFLSNFSINAYTNSNLFILGFYADPTVMGYYSIADKIIYAFRQVLNVFFQATYPQACKVAIEGTGELKKFFRRYFVPFALLVFVASICLLLTTNSISVLLTRERNPHITHLLWLMGFVPFVICLNIPAYQTLLAYDFQKSYMRVLVLGSVLNIVLNLILAKFYLATGTAVSIIITEIFITSGLYLALSARRSQLSVWKN